MIQEKIMELTQQMIDDWNQWRAVPENVPHPSTPNYDNVWAVIRMLRHVEHFGAGSLQPRQVKLVQLICGGGWWNRCFEAYPYKPKSQEEAPPAFKHWQHVQVIATPKTHVPASKLTIQERKARLLRLKEEALSRA